MLVFILHRDQGDHHERSRADEPLRVVRVVTIVVLELDDRRRVDGLAVLGVVLLYDLCPLGFLSYFQPNLISRHHVAFRRAQVRSARRLKAVKFPVARVRMQPEGVKIGPRTKLLREMKEAVDVDSKCTEAATWRKAIGHPTLYGVGGSKVEG